MAKRRESSVRATGARPGQILVGIGPFNLGLRVKVQKAQAKGRGGRVEGPFDLIHEGSGKYASCLDGQVGKPYFTAAELLREVSAKGGNAAGCMHILNCNELQVDPNQLVDFGKKPTNV